MVSEAMLPRAAVKEVEARLTAVLLGYSLCILAMGLVIPMLLSVLG
jgi:hypothetical protein